VVMEWVLRITFSNEKLHPHMRWDQFINLEWHFDDVVGEGERTPPIVLQPERVAATIFKVAIEANMFRRRAWDEGGYRGRHGKILATMNYGSPT